MVDAPGHAQYTEFRMRDEVRVNDPTFVAPLVIGILVWLGLFLREERLGSLLPLRH